MNETGDGFGHSGLLVGCGCCVRGRPHAGGRLAHRHRQPGTGEHRKVVRHVAECCDLRELDPERLRQRGNSVALVGEDVSDIEIIKLGALISRTLIFGVPASLGRVTLRTALLS